MKKFFNITLIAVMGCLFMASCSDDDYTDKINSVAVTAGQTEIPAAGATKTITVTGEGIKAEADDEWLNVSVDGNVITVSADANYSRESRHTFVNITAANGDFLQVNVSQLGAVFVLDAPTSIVYGNTENTVKYDFDTNLDVTISTSDPWLSAELVDGKLTISTESNTTGRIRTGYVYYQAGTLGDRISVTQGEIDKDVVGKYYIFGGIDPDDGSTVAFLTQITKSESNYAISFPTLGLEMPVTIDNNTLSVTISGGQPMGIYGAYNVFSVMGNVEEGMITWSTSVTMTAHLSEIKGSDNSIVAGAFRDNGAWTYACDMFGLGAFRTTTPSSSSWLGGLAYIANLVLQEYEMNAAAPNKAMATSNNVLSLNNKYIGAGN